MAKIHLVQSQTPLTDGRDQDAMCGKTVVRAVIGAMVDSDGCSSLLAEMQNNTAVCQKCAATLWLRRYLYAVRQGQDA